MTKRQRIQFLFGCFLFGEALLFLIFQSSESLYLPDMLLFLFFAVILALLFIVLVYDDLTKYYKQKKLKEQFDKNLRVYLHDSVLQNLAIIYNTSDDPKIKRVAKKQERELREILYEKRVDENNSENSLVKYLKFLIASYENQFETEIEFNFVGDYIKYPKNEYIWNCLAGAIVQSIHNALTHGKPPFNIYFEANKDKTEVYIKDKGNGFDINKIKKGHFGLKESVINRIEEIGGKVEIKSNKEFGTEVKISI